MLVCVSSGCAHAPPQERALDDCSSFPVDATCESVLLDPLTEDPALAARFDSFTIRDVYLPGSTIEVIELRADGSLSVTGGGGPPVARAVMISPADLALARRVLTARELIELFRRPGAVCPGPSFHRSELMRIRAGGETLEKLVSVCDTPALRSARETMHRLAEHYGKNR